MSPEGKDTYDTEQLLFSAYLIIYELNDTPDIPQPLKQLNFPSQALLSKLVRMHERNALQGEHSPALRGDAVHFTRASPSDEAYPRIGSAVDPRELPFLDRLGGRHGVDDRHLGGRQ